MKTNCLQLITAGLMLCCIACKKNLDVTSGNKSVDVYVAGFVDGHYNEAAYWKNGVITKLTDSPSFAIARGIAVQGPDVYVVGTVTSANFTVNNAVYWKNGIATTLTSTSNNSQAWGIAFQGTNMYVVGTTYNNVLNSLQATYWKNGVPATLPGGYTANAIAVNGTDVYIAGSTGDANNSTAAYWKNGVITTLPQGFVANAIAVSGTDVYVGGTTNNGAAVYWKNDMATLLTNDAVAYKTGYSVYSIATNGTDVFVAGGTLYNDGTNSIKINGTGSVATFWKDNIPSILSVPTTVADNPLHNLATSIYLYGSDVYTTSQAINNSTQQYASYYWKNGVPVQLSDGGSNGAFAYSIIVVPQN